MGRTKGDVAASPFIKQVHFCPFFMHFICINLGGEGDAGGDTAGCGLEH